MIAHMWLDGWGILVGLASAAFWVVLILAIVALIRGRPDGGRPPGARGALRILEQRYARGEIPGQEFLERRAVLTGEAEPPAESRS